MGETVAPAETNVGCKVDMCDRRIITLVRFGSWENLPEGVRRQLADCSGEPCVFSTKQEKPAETIPTEFERTADAA